jgi:vacuolar-type H+-ATPase subunit C/Vma6
LPTEKKRSRIYFSVEEHLKRRQLFEAASGASDLKTLADILKMEDYASAINLGLEKYEENGETQLFDVLMDKAYYEYLWWTFCQLPQKEKPHAAFYANVSYDGFIILTILRGKALGYDAQWLKTAIPHTALNMATATVEAMATAADFEAALKIVLTTSYGEYFSKAETPQDTIANAEKAFKKALFIHAHKNRTLEIFNIGAPLAFMVKKEAETRNLSAICLGVENRWKPGNIQNSLLLAT